MKNKITVLFLIFTTIFSLSCFANVYEQNESMKIANGVTLNKITTFTSSGWTYLDIIEIDISEKNVRLGALTSSIGVSNFSTIKTMANEKNAIAGLNGDYFAKRPDTTQRGQSIGLLGENGEILVSSADENIDNQTMGSFILNNDSSVIYTYLTDTVTIHLPKNNQSFVACDLNKYVPYNSIGVFTSSWSDKSIGNSEGKELVEVIVVDNIVTEIRQYLEPTQIPENGYILSAYGPDAISFILDNFEIGDEVNYTIDINIDLEKMQFAISGGTMLVSNGEIPTFTHKIWGNNEMSAIGTNMNGDKVYLVACTCTNNDSTGISQKNFANLLKQYGMYNALCLDGGGSTTMVAKQLGDDSVSTILSRSTSYLRPVANGIGIFNLSEPTGKIKGLIVDLKDEYIFKNNSTSFSIKAYDTNYYNIDVDNEKVNVTFNNDIAKYEDGKIIGLKEGTTKITITYLGKSITKQLKILGDVYRLDISPKNTSITIDDVIDFKLKGIDKNGYIKEIDNSLVEWKIETGKGQLTNGTYTPEKHETVLISASIDNVISYSTININTEKTDIYDDFEDVKGEFSAYPTDITGDIDISKSKKKSGKYSVKLSYDFTNNTQAVRGAYYDYTTPLELPNNISEIGLWIYSPNKNDNAIKSQYLDKKGNTYIDVLVDKIDWTGWKYITYPSYSKISKIVSIYVAQANQDITNDGYIYIDNLTVTYLGNDTTNLVIPNDVVEEDIDNRVLNNSYCISVIDKIKYPSTLFDNISNNRLVYAFNNYSDLLLTYETLSNNIVDDLYVEHKKISSYTITDKKSTRMITIDNSNKGIKNTDFSQWENLVEDIDVNKHIIIFLTNSLDSFSDTLEKNLLLDKLEKQVTNSGKKCFLIQYGSQTNVEMYNGIKIITIGKISANNTIEKILDNYRYINLYISSNDISYRIMEIF